MLLTVFRSPLRSYWSLVPGTLILSSAISSCLSANASSVGTCTFADGLPPFNLSDYQLFYCIINNMYSWKMCSDHCNSRVPHSPPMCSITVIIVSTGYLSLKLSPTRVRVVRSMRDVRDFGVSVKSSFCTSWQNYRASVMVPVYPCKRCILFYKLLYILPCLRKPFPSSQL